MFKITRHAKERYLERKKYSHLRGDKLVLAVSHDLAFKQGRKLIEDEMLACLCEAKEERWFINNTNIMGEYYEKYGYKNFKFLVHEEITYVLVHEDGQDVVLTCIASSKHKITRNLSKNNFTKKEKVFDPNNMPKKAIKKMRLFGKS